MWGRGTGLAIAALSVGGCASLLDLPVQPADGADMPEAYYHRLVAGSGLPARLTKSEPGAPVQVSALRRSVGPQPGDWTTCLRATVQGKEQYLAVFFRNRVIIESRSGIEVDRCGDEQYSPLQSAAAAAAALSQGPAVRTVAPAGPRMPGLY